jgi:outer membrane lipoprotein-sorting protein
MRTAFCAFILLSAGSAAIAQEAAQSSVQKSDPAPSAWAPQPAPAQPAPDPAADAQAPQPGPAQPAPAPAADAQAAQQDPAQPAAGAAGGWSSSVTAEPETADPGTADAEGQNLDAKSIESINQVSAYFNDITHLQGRFVQTDAANKQTKGKFYVHRPGRLRFEYAKPSLLRIISDGKYLSIEDHDLKTVDKYPLDSTPFRMLLSEEVNLIRDARIVGFSKNNGTIMVTIEDKSGESPGKLQLFFNAPEASGKIELKEWVITDPQGLDTRIQLANLVTGEEVPANLFDTSTVEFPEFTD